MLAFLKGNPENRERESERKPHRFDPERIETHRSYRRTNFRIVRYFRLKRHDFCSVDKDHVKAGKNGCKEGATMKTKRIGEKIESYLKSQYPDWNKESLLYKKY